MMIYSDAADLAIRGPMLLGQAFGVLVGDRHRQLRKQLLHRLKYRRGVGEFREHDQAHRQKRRAAGDRRIDQAQHPIGVGAHLTPVDGIWHVGLARRSGIADHFTTTESIDGKVLATTRVLYVARYC